MDVGANPFEREIADVAARWIGSGWPEAADAAAAVTAVLRAARAYENAANDALRPLELNASRYEVLQTLNFSESGRLSLGTLSKRTRVQPASITNTVDKLAGSKLCRRVQSTGDRRLTLAAITPKGREVVSQATDALNARLFTATSLAPAELEALTRLSAVISGDFHRARSVGE